MSKSLQEIADCSILADCMFEFKFHGKSHKISFVDLLHDFEYFIQKKNELNKLKLYQEAFNEKI